MKLIKILVFAVIITISSICAAVEQTPIFSCKTEKHTIQIDKIGVDTYKYRSWNNPKTVNEKPDMELSTKDVSVVGTGACRHNEYRFKTGKVEYLLDDDTKCLEGKPPAKITGNLSILLDDKLKNHFYCLKSS